MTFKILAGNDGAFLEWLKEHPDGYVLNVRKSPDPAYVVLHRAQCRCFARPTEHEGGYTGRAYRKIVARTEAELKLAAVAQGRAEGSFSMRCSKCCRP